MQNSKELNLNVPDVGQSGEIEFLEWKISVGEGFNSGDEICDLITDKAAFSLEAPESGILTSQFVSNGEKVVTGQVLGRARVTTV